MTGRGPSTRDDFAFLFFMSVGKRFAGVGSRTDQVVVQIDRVLFVRGKFKKLHDARRRDAVAFAPLLDRLHRKLVAPGIHPTPKLHATTEAGDEFLDVECLILHGVGYDGRDVDLHTVGRQVTKGQIL